ncbi:MAG: patatin-like phospholipase family protein [Ketobacteraceae bacterium]|nr:patatin-like phospholipase family protein [Ketobacteraceae bacterium]
MSSGFFSFFAHAGMLAALLEEDCEPGAITGSSAGALVGACWASGMSMSDIRGALFTMEKADFWDPAPGLGVLRGARFRHKLRDAMPVSAFDQCRVPLALSAFDLVRRQTAVFRQGNLVDCVYASCAFPLLFQPIRIGGSYYLDGGIKDRPALASVRPGERVLYHHIKSRSPWRRKNSPALKVPERDNMQSIALDNIPRVGPNRLEEGPKAFDAAYKATLRQLQGDCA